MFLPLAKSRSQPPPLSWLSHSGHYSSDLITPGQGSRQWERQPLFLRIHWNSSNKLANPKPACPVLLIPSNRNYNKVFSLCFPQVPSGSWPTLRLPCVTPLWHEMIRPFGNCKKPSFQWPSFSNLLASPYWNNKKLHLKKTPQLSTLACVTGLAAGLLCAKHCIHQGLG